MSLDNKITELLSQIQHPEYKDNITSLGMVENLVCDNDTIHFSIQLKRPNDPFASSVKRAAIQLITQTLPEYTDKVSIIIKEPAPKPKKEKEEVVSDAKVAKNIIAVSSAKGGVGKSTVTASLSVTLAAAGYKVGVLDADIYGPSQHIMFGVKDYMPNAVEENGHEYIIPAENYGVEIMSIGFFIKDTDALVWRGPMATNALKQLIHQTKWGKLDYLFIDMPPGTGDIHLTLISELKITGAIIVSTPQNIALADVIRGISMFRSEKVNVPVIGLIENMAWFTPEELPQNKYYIFGKGGCRELAKEQNIPLLAEIPLVQSIREGADNGTPEVLTSEVLKKIYDELTLKLTQK